ncbi:MAG: nitroreductase family deazaflavin-dependent oxidoreductase [Acidimicrobiia bacterium]|nr:nitroreductase family deazaflavin-dependent oxidoreductase [Acidimicrobiia bacterium]
MHRYQRMLGRLGSWSPFRWLLSKVLSPLDLRLRDSRFAPSKLGVDYPLGYLTTTGRTSGEPRTVPLLFCELPFDGDRVRYAVAATNFGTKHHPGWSYNLDAAPVATFEIEGANHTVTAARLDGPEADIARDRLRAIWPAYATYRDRTTRDIRIYTLTVT